MTNTDLKILTLIKNDITNVLYNARALRDMPYENDKERDEKLNEVINETSLITERFNDYIGLVKRELGFGETNGTAI
jgi:hypothetical protein